VRGRALFAGLLLALAAPAWAQTQDEGRRVFVAAAPPLATEAGLAVLRRGGSAIDAAIAVQAMLGLVEPQSSGIGGGAFLTYYDAATRRVTVYDGRETAPAGATPDMFLDDGGRPMRRAEAMLTGRAVGVPGVVRMLELAHRDHGRLAWRDLFGDARATAEAGFTVTARLARYVHGDYPQSTAPDVRRYFAQGPDGALVRAGDRLRNPAYAAFLGRLAEEGPSALYAGETARRLVARVRGGPDGGTMTEADLAGYRAVRREALCRPFRIVIACAPPPPSSGVGLLQLLALLDDTDIAARGPDDPQAWFLFAEASRIMYADRDRYVGDPAFVRVPVAGLLDPAYVAGRAALIRERAGDAPEAGRPPQAAPVGADATHEPAGTSHFVIVDADGNAVSMTTTVESYFGSGRMVDGFFLNNQMTDFSLNPRGADGRLAANAVQPGKRPRSSMSPLILLHADQSLAGALGSPGGNAILAYVAKTMVGLFDWGLPMQDAIALPNLVARGDDFNGEADRMSDALRQGLRERGVTVRAGSGEDSGLHGVLVRPDGFDGGADPRRDGTARTETVPALQGDE
jgi:gamma-glutamyltranspeptidase/glutathione hydrolase